LAGSPFTYPFYRLRDYLHILRVLVEQTRDEVQAMRVELAGHLTRLEAIASSQVAELEKLAATAEAVSSSRDSEHAQLVEILRFVHDRSQWRRVRLRELRVSDAYARAYSDPDPLVSVVIPTRGRDRLLRDRAIPSVLAQTHQNFEVVVVGDAASDETRVVVESFGDPRLSFFNLPYRGPYPDEPAAAWLVSGVPARNEAVDRARGLWIAPLDDDGAFRPHHIERLLARAREQELELCFGQHCQHLPDGTEHTHGRFPPVFESFNGLPSAIYHAGLADIFEHELADAAFGLPHDWAFCRRMMEAGVRMGMLNEVTVDYYPAMLWTEQENGDRLGPWLEPRPQ
jgi:hypothetical protein